MENIAEEDKLNKVCSRILALEAQLEDAVGRRLAENDGSHDLLHLKRVRTNALAIAKGEIGVDIEVLLAAVWLHDLVPVEKDDCLRHTASRRCASESRRLLESWGWSTERTEAVVHAVEAHSFSGGIHPRTVEAAILRDADRLDALGAVGVARAFYVAGRLGVSLYDGEDPSAQRRLLDDRRYALDHFPAKLLRLEQDMLTKTGRDLARDRAAFTRSFLDRIWLELSVKTK